MSGSGSVKDSFYYGASNIIAAISGLIVLPIYTHAISVEDFGLYEILNRVSAIVLICAVMGTFNGFIRYFFDKETSAWKAETSFTTLIFLLFSSVILSAIVWFARDYIFLPFTGGRDIEFIVMLLCVWMPIDVIYGFCLVHYQVNKNAKGYFYFSISKTVIFLILTIYMVTYKKMGIEGIVLANILAGLVLAFPKTILIIISTKIRFSMAFLVSLIAYGLPYLPATIFAYIAESSGRYVLAESWTMAEVGLYALGAKIAVMAVMVMHQAFMKTWGPFLFSTLKECNAQEKIISTLENYKLCLLLYAMAVALGGPVLVVMFSTEEYYSASWIVPAICFGSVIQCVAYLNDYGMLIKKKTKYKPLVTFYTALTAVLTSLLLIPWLGVAGAAVSYALSMLVLLLSNQYYSNKFYPLNIHWRRLILLYLLAASLTLIAMLVNYSNQYIPVYLLSAFSAYASFVVIAWRLGLVSSAQKLIFFKISSQSIDYVKNLKKAKA